MDKMIFNHDDTKFVVFNQITNSLELYKIKDMPDAEWEMSFSLTHLINFNAAELQDVQFKNNEKTLYLKTKSKDSSSHIFVLELESEFDLMGAKMSGSLKLS